MKAIHWTIAAAAFACTEPVQAGVNDPEVIIGSRACAMMAVVA
jgi:hypothetical protein